MSLTPSHSSSPSRTSVKRTHGDSQTFSTASQPEEHGLTSPFCSLASFASTASSTSSSANSQDASLHNLVAERPEFFCDWPTCHKNPNSPPCSAPLVSDSMGAFRSGIGFRRQEHLKRHMSTHIEPKSLPCRFCQEEGKESKKWIKGRNDNFKAHVQLHVKNADGKKKGTRTTYRPEAAMLLKWLEKQQGVKKQGKSRKSKADADEEDDNVKDESEDIRLGSVEDRKMTEIVRKYWIGDDVHCKSEM